MVTTMESMNASTHSPPPSLRTFAARHRRATLGGLAAVILLAAAVVFGTLGARMSHVNDSTSCSGWSASTQAQQKAYAALYLKEHARLPNGTRDPGSVELAVNNGCIQAFSFDEADTISVIQAINHQY